MKLTDGIRMAIDDIKRRKFRTFLTAFAVAIGTVLVIDMMGIGQGFKDIGEKAIKDNGFINVVKVQPKGNVKLNAATVSKLRNINGVDRVAAYLNTKAAYVKINGKEYEYPEVSGVDTKFNTILKMEESQKGFIKAGRLLKEGDANSAVVSDTFLKDIGIKDYKNIVGKRMNLVVSVPVMNGFAGKKPLKINLKVVGIIKSKDEDIRTDVNVASNVQGYYTDNKNYLGSAGYSFINVEAKKINNVNSIFKKINKEGYSATAYVSQAENIRNVMKIFNILLTIGGLVVLLAACIGVINTMTMAVQEKTKAIGIMKATGASQRDIKSIFTTQSAVIGFIGGIAGIILAMITAGIVNKAALSGLISIGMNMMDIKKIVIIQLNIVIEALLITVFMSILSGFLPARKAAKLDPVETLNYE